MDQSIQVGIVGFLFQGNDQRSIPFRLSTGQRDAGHFLADTGTFFVGELGTGMGIQLTSVIYLCIMTRCNIHSTGGAGVDDGKGKFRCGARLGEKVYRDAQGSEGLLGGLSQFRAAQAAVPAQADSFLPNFFPLGGQEKVAEGQGGLGDGKAVDSARPQGGNSPESGSAEGKGRLKCGAKSLCRRTREGIFFILGKKRALEPLIQGCFPVFHHHNDLLKKGMLCFYHTMFRKKEPGVKKTLREIAFQKKEKQVK